MYSLFPYTTFCGSRRPRCARAGHEGGSIESAVSRTGWRALTRTAAAPGRRGLPCRKPGQSGPEGNVMAAATLFEKLWQRHVVHEPEAGPPLLYKSEERRVGKGGVSTCRSRWSP